MSQILNIARETTVMEFAQMMGIPNKIQREMGVDLTAGRVNAVAITQKIMGAPRMEDMLKAYMEAKAKKLHTGGSEEMVMNVAA